MIGRSVFRVALYIEPSGIVRRIANPLQLDPEDDGSLIGVYDDDAREADIVADILELAA